MTRARTILVLLTTLGVLALGFATASIAAGTPAARFKIIVHPRNPAAWIDKAFLRNAYLRKEIEWQDGTAILPVDLGAKIATRELFIHDVLKKTPAQLKSYWNQRIFSGKGAPPPAAEASAAAIAYVLANPGSVGYLPAELDPGGAKVIEVR